MMNLARNFTVTLLLLAGMKTDLFGQASPPTPLTVSLSAANVAVAQVPAGN